MEILIQKFIQAHTESEKFLETGNIVGAKQKYLEALDTYHKIDQSSLEHFHKELAHDQITSLFKKVNSAKSSLKVPPNIIAAAVLLIVLSATVAFKPSVVGLAGFDDVVKQDVSLNISESSIHQLALRDRPLSLSASGEFVGKVKLFHKEGERLKLIFESDGTIGNFTDACVESCSTDAASNNIEVFAQLEENSSVFVSQVSYKIEHRSNTAPRWTGSSSSFQASVGKPTTIDLSNYFADDENDPLVFLSTAPEGVDVTVQDSSITIKSDSTGTKNLLFIASDLIEVTRVPVTVEVS